MYRDREWRNVRTLRGKGMSKPAVARALGMSRNTVDKLLRLSEPPVFRRRNALTKKEELALERLARAIVTTAFEMVKNHK